MAAQPQTQPKPMRMTKLPPGISVGNWFEQRAVQRAINSPKKFVTVPNFYDDRTVEKMLQLYDKGEIWLPKVWRDEHK
jgi:hypothetical protein